MFPWICNWAPLLTVVPVAVGGPDEPPDTAPRAPELRTLKAPWLMIKLPPNWLAPLKATRPDPDLSIWAVLLPLLAVLAVMLLEMFIGVVGVPPGPANRSTTSVS